MVMFKDERLKEFVTQMSNAMEKREKVYGDTWKTMDVRFLEQRMTSKYNEFKLTKNPSKLVSLVNLAMLLNVRMKEENGSDYSE